MKKPRMILDGVGLITPTDELVKWLAGVGVPVDPTMSLEEILDFARWEERGATMRLHFQQGQIWVADVKNPIISGKLVGSRLPGW